MTAQRNIVKIDQDKCNGCGLCVNACAEGAIEIVDGKAHLVSEVYCDGLGACLGHCPQDAITIEQREAAPFDEAATEAYLKQKKQPAPENSAKGFVCPGSLSRQLTPQACPTENTPPGGSQLANWPVQLHLVPPQAPYWAQADLLLAADCVPFALGDFHQRLLQGRPVIIGCPKLDDGSFYADKLTEILRDNDVKSITVAHMEVPCCSGLVRIAERALTACGKQIPARDITVSIAGKIIRDEPLTTT